MEQYRNLDIKKVSKQVPHHHKHLQQHTQKPVLHPASSSINYFRLIAQSWSAVFKSAIFQLSLLRNLLSIRAIVFAVLPLLYFQLNYILVSKPDRILNKIKAVVTAQNTSGFITLAAVVLGVLLISFLADLLIYPAITRYYYQLLGKRKPKMGRALNESMSLSYASLASRSIKLFMFVVTAVLIAGMFYVSYILGYGDLRQMVIFSSIAFLAALIVYCLYVNFKFWIQTGFAVEGDEGEGRFLAALRSTFGHPIGSIGFATNWLITLVFFVIVSLFLAVGEVLIVNSLDSVWYQIGTLALGTTLVYLIWTTWTAWQLGYWTSIAEHYGRRNKLHYGSIDEPRSWQYISLIMIATLTVLGFILLSYTYSDRIINLLDSASQKIPNEININLPKPQ